jgi:vacuolar-type H+-ATPase subunit E/Vma4
MGLEELVRRLERDADARVAAVEAKAREAIAAIEAEAARDAEAREAEELAKKRAARTLRAERDLSVARLRANAEVLAARQAMFDRVIARARELLDRACSDEAYRATVPEQIRAALEFTHAAAVVRCRPELAELARAIADVVSEDPAMPAGFVVEAGSLVIDETLVAKLARMRDALVMELAREMRDG